MKNRLQSIFAILIFALPIIGGQLGQMLFGIGDILVAGHYSSQALSAIGVATAMVYPFLLLGMGLLTAIGPLTSSLRGQQKEDPTFFFNAALAAISSGLVLGISLFGVSFFVHSFGINSAIEADVVSYLRWASLSIIPSLFFQAGKEYLQGLGKTFAPNLMILIFNFVNILLCIAFMFGFSFLPAMGVKGAGISLVVCRFLMSLGMLFYLYKNVRLEKQIHSSTLRSILKLGLPVSFAFASETLVFSVVTVLIGKMSLVASAAQSLVINLASLTFMVALGISTSSAVLVGEQFGKQSLKEIKEISEAALTLIIFIQVIFAFIYFLIPKSILGLGSQDDEVIHYAASLLFWVAIFQIPDGLQAVLSGILRGLQDTKAPAIFGVLAYWILGLPLGCYLAYEKNLAAKGLWMGLTFSLFCMSIILFSWYRRKLAAKSFSSVSIL